MRGGYEALPDELLIKVGQYLDDNSLIRASQLSRRHNREHGRNLQQRTFNPLPSMPAQHLREFQGTTSVEIGENNRHRALTRSATDVNGILNNIRGIIPGVWRSYGEQAFLSKLFLNLILAESIEPGERGSGDTVKAYLSEFLLSIPPAARKEFLRKVEYLAARYLQFWRAVLEPASRTLRRWDWQNDPPTKAAKKFRNLSILLKEVEELTAAVIR